MKETIKVRFMERHAHLLFNEDEGKKLGPTREVTLDMNSPVVSKIGTITKYLWENEHHIFFTCWDIRRSYTSKELENEKYFCMNIRKLIEADGAEYGTGYDETAACPICGANRKQISVLKMGKGRYIKNRDVAITLGGDLLVSKRFVEFVHTHSLKGVEFKPVILGKTVSEDCFQMFFTSTCDLSTKTKFGYNPFGVYVMRDGEHYYCGDHDPYTCTNGDNMGLNIISETHIQHSSLVEEADFFMSRQTYGYKMGLYRPWHLFFCSQRAMRLMTQQSIRGFNFEVAHIDED